MASAWPLWEALEDGAAHRVAVAAGWDGTGHNWGLYPLLGDGLRHDVVYVPPTKSGRIIDYRRRDLLAPELDEGVWLKRLRAMRVDRVAILLPFPPEAEWVAGRPDTFAPMIPGQTGKAQLFAVHWPSETSSPRDSATESP